MNATNHAAAGVVIAVVIKEPAVALPLAFLSHFALDALPHFGYKERGFANFFKQRLTYLVVALDIVGVMTLLYLIRDSSWIIYVSGILAVSPDFAWYYRYFFLERKDLSNPGEDNAFDRWHSRIQWCERPWGLIVEVLFAVGALYLISWLLV